MKLARFLFLSFAVALTPGAARSQTLRERADTRRMLIGAAVRPSLLFSEPRYAATLAREFNLVEPENDMKWAALRPNRETFDYTAADQVVGFAEVHRMKVRGHTLVWGWSNPEWLTNLQVSPAEFSQLLQEHIERVASHFRGKVFAWDVINEAFDEHGNVKHSIWFDQPGIGLAGKGTAYIEQCFRWAHKADPQALLFYNDAEGETLNAKSDAICEMIRDFRKRGVPIDGVGLQMHIFDLNPDMDGIRKNIARFASLGVQVHITELDVALPVSPDGVPTPTDLMKQATIYRQIVSSCLETRGCTAIQMWGFTDKWSWIGSATHHTKGAGMLFDRNYAAKPAYNAFAEALSAESVRPARSAP